MAKVSETVGAWSPTKLAWAIHVVSGRLPGSANCLVRSLAAQAMLARGGYLSCVRIGVARPDSERFKAHAWLECDGKIIIGGEGTSQYTPLPNLQPNT